MAIVDAVSDRHLRDIAVASAGLSLITGGSGLAQGLPQNFRERGLLAVDGAARSAPVGPSADFTTDGFKAVVAGSCSSATRRQVDLMRAQHPSFRVDPLALANGQDVGGAAFEWAKARVGEQPILIYATAAPEEVKDVQAAIGVDKSAALVEHVLSAIALKLVELGVRQLIIAGGETSGAVLQALGITRLTIGPEIDPGVPWTTAVLDRRGHRHQALALALKSGNFGSDDFFLKAWKTLAPAA